MHTSLNKTARTRNGLWHRFVHSQKSAPYVFVLPFILSFLLFFAYPVVSTVVMSFQDVAPGATKFIGTGNYRNMLNPTFYKAVRNSAVYTFWTLLILIPVPLILAVWLNAKMMKWRNFFRSTLFIPALTSVVVAGTIFRLIFGELPGSLLNQMAGLAGIHPQRWLFEASTGMLAMVMLAVWRWTGINILYFLSGLQNIPHELYESAEIDGANRIQKLWNITIPLLKPVTIYVLTISVYGGFAMFTESYMLWSGNKSPNSIGLTMVGYIYQMGLEQNKLGMGSAIGVTLLGLTMILNLFQLKFFGLFRKEE